jgi:hypothetical protein
MRHLAPIRLAPQPTARQFRPGRLNLFQFRASMSCSLRGGYVLVEEAVEVDLVAYLANLLVLIVAEGLIDVGVRQMRQDFTGQIVPNVSVSGTFS